MSGTEVQMDITPENLLAREAFFFFPTRNRVMNSIRAPQGIVSDNLGAMEAMPANNRSRFSEQAIMRELNIGVSKMHQSLGHLDLDRKDSGHEISLTF
jgi:hypothetical protein